MVYSRSHRTPARHQGLPGGWADQAGERDRQLRKSLLMGD